MLRTNLTAHEDVEDRVPTYEFELRYIVKNHDPILESLRGMGAGFKSKLIQKDYYFSPPPLRTIEKGSILRIREETYEGDIKRIMLSFKTPNVMKKEVETREETEIEVLGDVQTVTRLLERLEAKSLVSVTKERIEYTLLYENIDFTITLDQVETLGSYIEIELVSSQKNDVNQLIALGEQLATKLGVDLSKKISLGYHELMLKRKVKSFQSYCKQR